MPGAWAQVNRLSVTEKASRYGIQEKGRKPDADIGHGKPRESISERLSTPPPASTRAIYRQLSEYLHDFAGRGRLQAPRDRGKSLKERSKSAYETAPAVLPPPRAFVVHLDSDAAPADGRLRGRAVHIASGEAAPFESLPELLRFLHAAIAQAEDGQAIDPAKAGNDDP